MNPVHFSNYDSVTQAFIGFTKICRESGLEIGLSEAQSGIMVMKEGFVHHENSFRYALKALFCTKSEQHEIFNRCFDIYWLKRRHNYSHQFSKGSSNITKRSNASLVMMGFNPNNQSEQEKEQEEAKSVTGISKLNALKYTDFSKVSEIDNNALDELAEQLLRQLNHRLKRKLTPTKKGKVDLRKTIRTNLSKGTDLIDLSLKSRKPQRHRLILLLDVSGSMDKYSFFLLKFIWSIKTQLKNIEAFVFSTKLVRITEYLHQNQLNEALLQMGQHTDNWSGGTKIGECLAEFNSTYAKQALHGRNTTIILSDGLDDGKPAFLSGELAKIKLRTRKLVWLNPLKGMKGYQPLAKGMKAAMPYVDEFESAHNLSSLLQLENLLADA